MPSCAASNPGPFLLRAITRPDWSLAPVAVGDLAGDLPHPPDRPRCPVPHQMRDKQLWVPDSVALGCMVCARTFNLVIRRHHCRRCGACMCSWCSHMTVSDKVRPRARPSWECDRRASGVWAGGMVPWLKRDGVELLPPPLLVGA